MRFHCNGMKTSIKVLIVAWLSLIVVRHVHTEGSSLDLAFSGRTEQRNYIEMGLSTPGGALSTLHQCLTYCQDHQQWNFPLGIWHFAIASTLVAVASLNK